MSQAGFLQALQEFPKDTINEEMVELMEPYFKSEDYTMENAKRVWFGLSILLTIFLDVLCIGLSFQFM